MRNPICTSLALFAACVLLGVGAGSALASDEPHGAQLPKTSSDHELTEAEKAALAKRRMQSCRLHPGSCEQGAKNARQRKDKHKDNPKADPNGDELPNPPVEGNPK